MGWNRWFYKATAGVEDFVEGADDDEINSRRDYVYWTIDHSSFQKWVVFVAGVGFFTDAYDIFAVNVVLPILNIVYWDSKIPQSYETALICSTLVGTLIGQVSFGILADKYGRRKIYGLELLVVISATLGVAMSATGAKGSMNIMAWLIFWRLVMGIGIGADYPLSAVICSEFAPRRHRARMMASVFFCQPIGQLLGMIVSLVVITASRRWISSESEVCQTDQCIQTLDRAWRWIVGFGSIPAVVATFFRLTIPESPRYLLDVVGAVKSASKDTRDYYNGDGFGQIQELMEAAYQPPSDLHVGQPEVKPSGTGTPSPSISMRADSEPSQRAAPVHVSSSSAHLSPCVLSSRPLTDNDENGSHHQSRPTTMYTHPDVSTTHPTGPMALNERQPPQASRQDFIDFFIKQKNWIYLFATSSSWFCLDFAFYGLALSVPAISSNIWHNPDDRKARNVYPTLLDNTTQSLVLVSIGTMTGSIIIIKAIKHWSSKAIQFYGFLALFVFFLILGGCFSTLLDSDYRAIIIVLYVLCQFFFNLGPNTTTFIIPAEIYPTRYRCTCHGISAAAGKLGSIIGQIFLAYVRFPGESPDNQEPLGWILMCLAIFMAIGAAVSRTLLPETRDERGKSRSLEVLAQGRVKLQALRKSRSAED